MKGMFRSFLNEGARQFSRKVRAFAVWELDSTKYWAKLKKPTPQPAGASHEDTLLIIIRAIASCAIVLEVAEKEKNLSAQTFW